MKTKASELVKSEEQDALIYFNNLLNTPGYRETFYSDVRYAIHLVEKHRADKAALITALNKQYDE